MKWQNTQAMLNRCKWTTFCQWRGLVTTISWLTRIKYVNNFISANPFATQPTLEWQLDHRGLAPTSMLVTDDPSPPIGKKKSETRLALAMKWSSIYVLSLGPVSQAPFMSFMEIFNGIWGFGTFKLIFDNGTDWKLEFYFQFHSNMLFWMEIKLLIMVTL